MYESRLELHRLWLADFDTDVTWIAAQQLWIVGRDGEKAIVVPQARVVPGSLIARSSAFTRPLRVSRANAAAARRIPAPTTSAAL